MSNNSEFEEYLHARIEILCRFEKLYESKADSKEKTLAFIEISKQLEISKEEIEILYEKFAFHKKAESFKHGPEWFKKAFLSYGDNLHNLEMPSFSD